MAEATDGSTKQWDKVRAMRAAEAERKGETPPAGDPPPPPEEKREDPPRNADGTFATAPPVVPPAEVTPPAEPVAATPPVEDSKPRSVTVKIDGQDVDLDPALAAAFEQAEAIRAQSTAATERQALVADVVEAVKPLLPKPKTEAELAADAALAEAARVAGLPKKPSAELLVSNPEEWQRQQDVYEEARITEAVSRSKAETLAAVQQQNTQAVQANEARLRTELQAEFYATYPQLKDSAALADPILDARFNTLLADFNAGKMKRPTTQAEVETLKKANYAEVAAQATRAVVKQMHAGRQVAPPPPPTLASSAPAKSPAPKVEQPEKTAPKYPPGSVSALIAERRAKRDGVAA